MKTNRLDSLVPMLFVKSLMSSIGFYEKLGFQVAHTFVPPEVKEPSWAWITSGGAHLMLAKASQPVKAEAQAVIFYTYCDDVAPFRDGLLKQGVKCSEITYPFYCQKGEFRVTDPDGWCLMVTHTG